MPLRASEAKRAQQRCCALGHSQKPLFGEGHVPTATDDHVIERRNADHLAAGDELPSDHAVIRRGCRIATRVVVHGDDGHDVRLKLELTRLHGHLNNPHLRGGSVPWPSNPVRRTFSVEFKLEAVLNRPGIAGVPTC